MDYIALSQELTFNPGDPMTQQCVNITIVDDTAVESSEFFSVRVTSTLLATSPMVTILINDDDG